MTLVVPNEMEAEVLETMVTPALTLRLYSNDLTPSGADVAADYDEVVGGGYVDKPLVFANWTITEGDPSVALYTMQQWDFTGATTAPGTVYGYYITRDSDSKLMWAERFPSGSLPFSPINGSIIRVIPRITADS